MLEDDVEVDGVMTIDNDDEVMDEVGVMSDMC